MKNLLILIFFLTNLISYSQKIHEKDYNQELEVSIVFHLIHPNYPEIDIKDEYFEKVIGEINNGFKKTDTTGIFYEFKDDMANCKINFSLALKENDCNSYYIEKHKAQSIDSIKSNSILDNIALKLTSYADPNKYMNIWIIPVEERGGFKLNPAVGEGAVIDYEHFIDKKNVQYSIVHEIGHVLNLNHIWGNYRWDFFNNNCEVDDKVDDTPKQKKLNEYGTNSKDLAEPSCNKNEASVSNWQNFMDYSYDIGMFTNGQKNRMRYFILNNKPNYSAPNKCEEGNPNELTIGFIKDIRDNQSYKWVQIGNQKWLAENLNYKTSNSKCYGNKESNCNKYGRLYDWNDAINVCPTGWRLPSKADWKQLTTTVNNNQNSIRSEQGWLNNKNGTNSSGLNFLPSGYKFYYTNFSGLGKFAKIWLSNPQGTSAYSRDIGQSGYDNLPQAGIDFKRDYLSCRCIEDKSSISNIDSQMPTIDNNTQESSSTINEDFFIGEWQGVGRIYALRKDKKYVIKFNSSSRSPLPPKPYAIWSYDGKFLKFKQRNRSPFVYTVKIISQTKIGLYNHDGSFFNYLNRKEIKPNSPTSSPNENIKKLNGRDYNRQSTQPKKKGVTLRDLIKKRN